VIEYEFLFVVDGVRLDDVQNVAVMVDGFDGQLSWHRGMQRLAVSGEGADAMDAAQKLVTRLGAEVPALRVLRLDPDLVGISDIADRTGHSRQNVQQWVSGDRNAERPFPPPEGAVGRSLAWRWADINPWLRALGLDDHATRPTREESTFIDAALIQRRRAAVLSPTLV
jgi:predicted DNA-binding transcriptional regulator AlpA